MRRIIFASHNQLATGLKKSICFLTGSDFATSQIIDISAYSQPQESDITQRVEQIFSGFAQEDEVIVLTDMLGGSVNQKFVPYLNDHVHLIAGMNLPLALSLVLYPEDEKLGAGEIERIVKEARESLVYVNNYHVQQDDDDE